MTKIVYIDHEGTSREIDVAPNMTVMEGAVRNNVPGIEAECGGACSCATCHVYVEGNWLDKLTAPSAIEKAMLDFAENVMPNSRLSCQIKVTDELEGLTVTTPENQS